MALVKVLHVIPAIAARYGGPSIAVMQMCSALGAAGVSVRLVSTDADGDGVLDLPRGVPTEVDGVEVVVFRRQWSEAFKYSRPLARWLDRHVADYDVVHAHALLSHAPLAAARACRRHGVPYLIRPLGTLDPWSLAQKPWRKRLLLACGGRRSLAMADAVHYTAAGEQRLVEASFKTRGGFVAPLGVDASLLAAPRLADPDRARPPFVLALSRLHPVKALDRLIDAFALAHRDDWRLVIAGTGESDYEAALKDRAARSRARDYISLVGWVGGEDKTRLLRTAAVLALPSHHENFGIGLAEALGCGTPVLLSPHVLVSDEIAEAGAGWVCENDVASLAAALGDVFSDPGAREQKGRAARGFAEARTWPRIAASLVETYESLSRASRGARSRADDPVGPRAFSGTDV